MLITTGDFLGKYNISITYGDLKLSQFITEVEPKIMNELFGVEMYASFTNGIPTGDFVQPLSVKKGAKILVSSGLKDMLICFIYAQYLGDTPHTATSGGATILQQEGGSAPDTYMNIYQKYYNKGVDSYKAIREFLYQNREDYPLFNGVDKHYFHNY